MKNHTHSPGALTDSELITRIHDLSHDERAATAQLVAHLAEFETRGLHHAEGYSSLFTYCTKILHFSEHAAYNRIAAARASREFPVVLDRLSDGSVHLTAVTLLAPHFTKKNCVSLLEEARHRSKAQILEIVARLRPLPAVSPTVRKLPSRSEEKVAPLVGAPLPMTEASPLSLLSAPPETTRRNSEIVPLAPAQYKVQFTASREMRERLMEAQALLRHRIPDGNPAAVLDLALKALLKEIKRRKTGEVDRPRAEKTPPSTTAPSRPGAGPAETTAPTTGRTARHIPSAVRRAVWARDGGRCAFRGRTGHRCTEKGFLEFHHVTPHAVGGPTTVDNMEIRCRNHNSHEAELFFGWKWTSVEGTRNQAS